MPGPHIVKIYANKTGKDYVIGDIHGAADAFQKVLDQLKDGDRLFLVGDLIDRGAGSDQIVRMIQEKNNGKTSPVVYAVRGNHEDNFLIACHFYQNQTRLTSDYATREIPVLFLLDGGSWIFKEPIRGKIDKITRQLDSRQLTKEDAYIRLRNIINNGNLAQYFISGLEKIKNYIESMPYIVTVAGSQNAQPFHICHADMPFSDDDLGNKSELTRDEICLLTYTRPDDFGIAAQYRTADSTRVYCGHNAMFNSRMAKSNLAPLLQRNQINLDVTATYTNNFLMVNHTASESFVVGAKNQYQAGTIAINQEINAHLKQELINKAVKNCKTPEDLDSFLKKNSTKGDLQAQKAEYLAMLGRIIPHLEQELRKQTVVYLINNDHLLKQERHGFRTKKFSNETRSMHRAVRDLLHDMRDQHLKDNTVEIDSTKYEFTRHTAEFK